MLSYIYQLAYRFEHRHDLRPNTLYLNSEHFEHLRHEFADAADIGAMTHYLGMYIVLTREVSHPHVARLRRNWHATTNTWNPAHGGCGRSIQH